MIKIILAIDDYNESQTCQTLLMKLGFDVISITKDSQFRSTTLGFLPDIVIASFKTKNVDGMTIGLEAKRLISKPRVMLLFPAGNEPKLSEEAKVAYDFMMSSPFDFEQLIRRTAEMARVDQKTLHDKYLKLHMRRPGGQGSHSVYGGKDITDDSTYFERRTPTSTMTSDLRKQRYQEYLAKMVGEPVNKVFDHKSLVEKVQRLERDSEDGEISIEAINAEKLEFAKALFKKS